MTLDEALDWAARIQHRDDRGNLLVPLWEAERLIRAAYEAGKRDAPLCGCRNGVHRCGKK